MNWQDTLCYSTPTFIEHTVNGKSQKFYPVSVALLFKLRNSAKGVVKAVSELFANGKNDVKTIDSTQSKPEGGVERTVVIEPIAINMAQYRDGQRATAWSNAIDAITDTATMELIAEIIMDSMRDVFGTERPTPNEFLQLTKLPTLVQMIHGTAKGNSDVFGPLGSKVSSMFRKLEDAATSKLQDMALTDKKAPNN